MDIIPSRKKSCPFCGAEEPPAWLLWNSGNWLEYHLLDYIGCDRIPADGIHDVLKIRSLPIMSSILRHLHPGEQIPGEKPCFYQCPFCPARRDTIGWFIGHVQREPHYNGSSMAVLLKACTVPKWQPKGPFNFLGLPAELRLKIYGYLLCFNKMKMKALYKQEDVIKLGIFWLQHNPLTNRLALLSVNRLVYYEARQFFYSRNTFSFGRTEDIPVFLFGIGEQNSSFLQSVMWPNGGGQRVNKIDFLRALMGTGNGKGPQQGRGITIWNNTEKYLEFLRVLNIITARNLRGFHRLLRPTHSVRDQLSIGNGDAPTRFVFNVTCQFAGGVEKEMTAGYTLFNR